MNNREYFVLCVSEVEHITELDIKDILSSNREECADARYILVYFLCLRLTDSEISQVSGMSRQRVNYLRLHFNSNFAKWSVKSKVQTIRKHIEEKMQTSSL